MRSILFALNARACDVALRPEYQNFKLSVQDSNFETLIKLSDILSNYDPACEYCIHHQQILR